MFESHPYDGHIKGETEINSKNIKRIEEACKDKTTLRFAFISDTQRFFDLLKDSVSAFNGCHDTFFAIHRGDIQDAGLTKDSILLSQSLNRL